MIKQQLLVKSKSRSAYFISAIAYLLTSILGVLIYRLIKLREPEFSPWILFFASYFWLAYLFLPFVNRLINTLSPSRLSPLFAVSADGKASDPINLIIITNHRSFIPASFKAASWFSSEKGSIRSFFKQLYAILLDKDYPNAPMSKLYLFGRPQDFDFQKATGETPSPRARHHIRFWKVRPTLIASEISAFWLNYLELHNISYKHAYVAAATYDKSPLAFRRSNLQITHKIDPKTDKERDYIIKDLLATGHVVEHKILKQEMPLEFKHQTFGVKIKTDGDLHILYL